VSDVPERALLVGFQIAVQVFPARPHLFRSRRCRKPISHFACGLHTGHHAHRVRRQTVVLFMSKKSNYGHLKSDTLTGMPVHLRRRNPVLVLAHQPLELKLLCVPHAPCVHRMAIRQDTISATHPTRLRLHGPDVRGIEMQQHADEEEEQEGDAVEDEDVGDVGDVGAGEEEHLFFGGAQEEESGCVEELLDVSAFTDYESLWTSKEEAETGRTKGVKYCQLLTSSTSVSDSTSLSFSTNAISTIRAAPAAIRVHPKTMCTCALSFRLCGCALIAQPVSMITTPGMRFLFGRPSLFRLSHTPSNPAHHHTIPMLVCCRSFWTHAVPHSCSVNVLTQPHAAISKESKNS